jgi:cell surface protein SprA
MKFLMMTKNITVNATINDGTTLPGFKPRPQYLGQNFDNQGPGWEFIAAIQNPDYRNIAARNGWVSKDPRLTSFYMQNYSERYTGKATLEPITDLRVEVNVEKNRTLTTQSLFRYDTARSEFRDITAPVENGTYSITYNTLFTTFDKDDQEGVSSAFKQFEQNRIVIANRLAENPNKPGLGTDSLGFPKGYSRTSQEVLIPAFLSAYRGRDPSSIDLTPFPQIPLPNWRITYNGLSKLEAIKEYASNVTINNMYESKYTVASFQTILDTAKSNYSGDYTSKYQIRQISITERWGPFVGIDITFVNNITTKLEYKRERTLNFSLNNQQLSEQKGSEFVIGIGYNTQKLTLPFKIGGRKRVLENNINFRLDFSIREAVTRVRYLDRASNDPVLGQVIYMLKPTIDYNINERLLLRIFYDYRRTDPATSNSFPTIIQSGGFSLRYTLQ